MTRRILSRMYSPRELNIIYSGNRPESKCCFKGCDNYVAGNTEERFCSHHWDLHVEMIIFGYGPFGPKSRKPNVFKRLWRWVVRVYNIKASSNK
jgi:hypothetical protein